MVNAANAAWGSVALPDLRLADYVLDASSSSIGALNARWAGDLSDLAVTTTGLRVVVNAANTTWGNVAVNAIAVS